jgi:multidrug transporter EmrE-like cation transporter
MSVKTPFASVVMFITASALGALGAYLYKSGAENITGTWQSYLLNPRIIGGLICYGTVMVLFVAAFRIGGALTVLYPIYASTFIFGAIIAWYAYGTPIRPVHILGMLLMVGGMYLIGRQ